MMILMHFDDNENVFPTIVPGWDHTPRTGIKGVVLYNSTPQKFQELVEYVVNIVQHKQAEHRFVFVKSWNEWAEGNYLEPNLKWGKAYLDALAKVVLAAD